MKDKEKQQQEQESRHSMSHVLAAAIKELYPNVKFGMGPAIDNGFYYDFDMDNRLGTEDFEKIEAKMHEIIKLNLDITKSVVTKAEACEIFKEQPYKLELINDLEEGEITIYSLGDKFLDLCRGPHVENTKFLRSFAFKINKVAGAYWRGNEKNKMMQRVYVYGFLEKEELKSYVRNLEEALKRDHNKIGRELGYFTTVSEIGQGLAILLPKGARVVQLLQRFVEDEEQKRGYLLTKTPLLAKSDLYKISGHWDHYRDGMFVLGDENKDEEVFALRPMTCPFQFQAYLNKQRSYRDLPLRYNETSTLFRNESSGEMHGLIRLRQFTISEGHIACRPDQVEKEFKDSLELAKFMLKTLGLEGDVSYRFSKWDENNKQKYIGSKKEWENVQDIMREILNHLKLDYEEADGEAAFYGPKLDIQFKNVFGKEDTLITIQIDFQLAERFKMEYVDEDGQKKYPYVIHRTSIGCYERTLALILEKYSGALPVWLAPIQVQIIPVSEKFLPECESLKDNLISQGFRVELDDRNEKLGYKIRQAQLEKIPYMIIMGENEINSGKLAVRDRTTGETASQSYNEFILMLNQKNFKKD